MQQSRWEIVDTTFAGLPATEITGPTSNGYMSMVVGWGENGNMIVIWLSAPTKHAYNRVARVWRKMLRSVTWNQSEFREHWITEVEETEASREAEAM